MIEKKSLEKNSLPLGLILAFGVTSPLLKIGSLPLSPHVTFWKYPPPSPFEVRSFMDGPLTFDLNC